MNPYKDLGDLCEPTDSTYDPLTGQWIPPRRDDERGFILAMLALIAGIGLISFGVILWKL